MEIIRYSECYAEDVKDLLVELQAYIADLDREKYNIVTDAFRESYFEKTMLEVRSHAGAVFLAKEQERIVGLVVGIINNEAEISDCFCAPKRGRITELVVSKHARHSGIGQALLERMEQYFRENGCKGILIDVFAYNEQAIGFYDSKGYFPRSFELMKHL